MPYYLIGKGKLAADILDIYPNSNCLGFIVESGFENKSREIVGYEHLPVKSFQEISAHDKYILGVGDTRLRQKFVEKLTKIGVSPRKPLTYEARYFSKNTEVGNGTGFGFSAIIERNVKIGQHVVVMHNVLVSHDVVVGNNVVICPGTIIEGGAVIEDNVFIGANSSVAPGVVIGHDSHLGMGTACFKNIPSNSTALGSPARIVPSVSPKID